MAHVRLLIKSSMQMYINFGCVVDGVLSLEQIDLLYLLNWLICVHNHADVALFVH
jgi:hypothetical protein